MLYYGMRVERVQQASAQFEILNCRCGPQASFTCPSNCRIHILQNSACEEIRGISIELIVCRAADSLINSVSL